MHFNKKKANQYLPYIFSIGIGIGTANYIMNGHFSWVQSSILSLSTSFLIGYTLVSIASNKSWFEYNIKPSWKLYSTLFFTFFLMGVIATEVEHIIKIFVFSNEKYQPFSEGKMYLFNGIISLVLGFSFFQNNHAFPRENSNFEQEQNELPEHENKPENILEPSSPIFKLPVKQGEIISLILIQDIVYFEAFDNYSFIYDLKGEKRLCDYSLLFLQKRLGDNFLRVHRKYIINTSYIKHIKPHSNARYLIQFDAAGVTPIISSKSYSSTIRTLIKIQ